MIQFLAPGMLWLLPLVPLVTALCLLLQYRKRERAQRYANLVFPAARRQDSQGANRIVREGLPAALLLAALLLLVVAGARPTMSVVLPMQHDTVVLAIDISRSMGADDVKPNRLSAAQAAARSFIGEQPAGTRIAVVSFASTASLVQPPTSNAEDVMAAVDRLQLQNNTAIGTGILVSLQAILPNFDVDLISETLRPANMPARSRMQAPGEAAAAAREQDRAAAPGSNASAAIVLLSDGQATTGPDPVEAAQLAADRGIRIFTVGLGTTDGTITMPGGRELRVRLDEETLKRIAGVTGGEYFYASTATDLTEIYRSLRTRLVLEKSRTEVSALFALAAAALLMVSGILSLHWSGRIL